MKKIGIILDSTNCNRYLHNSIRQLAQNSHIQLVFLVNRGGRAPTGILAKIKNMVRARGMRRCFQLVAFKLMSAVEMSILSYFLKHLKEHRKTFSLLQFCGGNIVHVQPSFSKSGIVVRYDAMEIERIKALGLDLIVRGNAAGIFKGEIVSAAKDGIISYHHGDNRWNRGGPPGFWEVYGRRASTGFIIQILSEELDGGNVLFRGSVSTCRSYTENIVKLYSESSPCLADLLNRYAVSGVLPAGEEKTPYSGVILVAPTIIQLALYCWKTSLLFTSLAVSRCVLRRRDRWQVAYYPAGWTGAILHKGRRIENPAGRFFADPFVVTKHNRTICFVEDYSYKDKIACITAVEIRDSEVYSILGPIIQEPFHMSFPFLFEYQHELYMVPETAKANAIRLYKCVDFPLKWKYQGDLMSDCRAADSMVFETGDKWWLLTNLATRENGDVSAQLSAFYSQNPLGKDWTPHRCNPLVFNSEFARNGGLLDVGTAHPVRVRQIQGFDSYGCGATLARLTEITAGSFVEEQIGEIVPRFFPGIRGAHHMHGNDQYTVYDFCRRE